VVEQNTGQMVEDVRLALEGKAQVRWHGVMPGLFVTAGDLVAPVLQALEGVNT
jgi:2-oxoglutarate ferredoxin oxidoreductase subunit alpha